MENEQDKQQGPEGARQAPQDPAQQVARGNPAGGAPLPPTGKDGGSGA